MQKYRSNDSEGLPQKTDSFRLGAYISRGCALFKKTAAGFITFTIIQVFIPCFIGWAISVFIVGPQYTYAAFSPRDAHLSSMPGLLIPRDTHFRSMIGLFIGLLINLFIAGPLNTGFFIVVFKLLRHQETTSGDFFLGFRNRNYLSLCIVGFINYLPLLWGSFSSIPDIQVLLLLPGIYLIVAYTFALPLVLETNMNSLDAMERSRKIISKKWFAFFALYIVLILINLIGPLLLVIGSTLCFMIGFSGGAGTPAATLAIAVLILGPVVLLVTIPFSSCVIAAAYADIVGLPSATVDV